MKSVLLKYIFFLAISLTLSKMAHGQKYGKCPQVQNCNLKNYLKSFLLNIIFGNCKDDYTCSGESKCCLFSCDQSFCLTPIKPTIRPGQCPMPSGPGGCINGCESDDDCENPNQKCCSNGCGSVCMDPVTVCPIDNSPTFCEIRNNTCHLDNECGHGFRCCPGACGTRCIQL